MKKKVFLAVVLIVLMAVGAFAQYTAESNFQVTKTATAVTITKYTGTGAAEINIPPKIQNLPVTTLASNIIPSSNWNVTSITIPASVTKITFGNNAFQGATKVDAASKTALQKVGYTGAY